MTLTRAVNAVACSCSQRINKDLVVGTISQTTLRGAATILYRSKMVAELIENDFWTFFWYCKNEQPNKKASVSFIKIIHPRHYLFCSKLKRNCIFLVSRFLTVGTEGRLGLYIKKVSKLASCRRDRKRSWNSTCVDFSLVFLPYGQTLLRLLLYPILLKLLVSKFSSEFLSFPLQFNTRIISQ